MTAKPNLVSPGAYSYHFCAKIHLFHAPLPSSHVAPCLSLNLPDQRNTAWAGGGRPQVPPQPPCVPTAASQPPALRSREPRLPLRPGGGGSRAERCLSMQRGAQAAGAPLAGLSSRVVDTHTGALPVGSVIVKCETSERSGERFPPPRWLWRPLGQSQGTVGDSALQSQKDVPVSWLGCLSSAQLRRRHLSGRCGHPPPVSLNRDTAQPGPAKEGAGAFNRLLRHS